MHICDCGAHYDSLAAIESCQMNYHGQGHPPPPERAALRTLLDVCRQMDAENQMERPTEEEYQAALAAAEEALG